MSILSPSHGFGCHIGRISAPAPHGRTFTFAMDANYYIRNNPFKKPERQTGRLQWIIGENSRKALNPEASSHLVVWLAGRCVFSQLCCLALGSWACGCIVSQRALTKDELQPAPRVRCVRWCRLPRDLVAVA